MKRILFLHQASTIGGGSYCLLNVIKNIDRSKFQPIVALNGYGPLVDEIEKLGIEVIIFPEMAAIPYNHNLFNVFSLFSYYKVYKSISVFKQLINNNNIDIVYLNNMMIYHYLKPAKNCGCKTIMHVREHWPLDEHKHQLQWARDTVNYYCDQLIAINQYSASIFPQKESTIIYDYIDFSTRSNPSFSMSETFGEDINNLSVFLFTGGKQKIKGAYEVVKAFTEMNEYKNIRLLMMGITPTITSTGLKGRVRSFLNKIGITSYEFRLIQLIKNDKRIKCIPGAYKIKEIIKQSSCMLSYYTIPHANLALAECLYLGTPVIAANTEESIEYSCQSTLSHLFEFSSHKSFKEILETFIRNTNHFAENKPEKAVIEKFDKTINTNRMNNLLNNFS